MFLSFHTHHHVFRFVLNFVTKCLPPPEKIREGEHFKGEFCYTILLHTLFITEGCYCGLPLSERSAPCKDKLPNIGDKIVCGQYFRSIPHNLHYVVEADRDCLMQNALKIRFIQWTYCENRSFTDSVSDLHNFLRKKSNYIIDIQIYFWYIWIAERNYSTFGQCFQVRKHTIMYRHSFWIRFLPHNADYVVFLFFCPDFSHICSNSSLIPLWFRPDR